VVGEVADLVRVRLRLRLRVRVRVGVGVGVRVRDEAVVGEVANREHDDQPQPGERVPLEVGRALRERLPDLLVGVGALDVPG